MNERYLLLEQTIRHDLAAIDRLYGDINSAGLAADASQEDLIVLGYRLHSLYNAFENLFQNIAGVFGNSLDDDSRWHAQLLGRMRLDLMPVRPAVIDQAAYDALDELRRFRHVFRYAYGVDLDVQRLRLVLDKALGLQVIYRAQIGRILDLLRSLWSDA